MAKNLNTTAAASATKTRAKTRAKKTKVVTLNHEEVVSSIPVADEFSALLAELEPTVIVEDDAGAVPAEVSDADLDDLINLMPVDGHDEIAETPVETEMTDEEIMEAVERAEATEVMVEATTVQETPEGAAPTEGKIAKISTAPVAAKEPKEKKAATPRKHYSDKVERLKDRMGESLGEYMVLTSEDAMVDEAELSKVMESTLEIIRNMNSKEKNRASNFIEFISGKGKSLNNVLERVLKVLTQDGYIQTGIEGNVIKNLLARPYSLASARAMGGNTIGMFADLKVIVPEGGKGRFVANPDSLLLAKVRTMIDLTAPAA